MLFKHFIRINYLCKMNKFVFLVFLLFSLVFNINAQSVKELDAKNGFKELVLMSDVKQYEHLTFKKGIEDDKYKLDEVDLYNGARNHFSDIGGIKIQRVEVKAFQNLIYEIKVTVDKDPKLYKGLSKKYGKGAYSIQNNGYNWAGSKVSLEFASSGKNEVQLTYFSKLMNEVFKQGKEKEVEDIADDF